MKKNSYFFIISLFSLLVQSCEDVIDIKISGQEAGMYAVEARITTEENPWVYLYKSLPVNSSEGYKGISGAQVYITDDSQPPKSIRLVEDPSNAGLYMPMEGISYKGEHNKKYTVTVSTGETVLTASDTLTKVEPVDSMQVRSSLRGNHRFLGVFVYGNETPGIGNYYKWDIYINNKLLGNTEYLAIASDELVDGNYIYGFEIFTDFHDLNQPSQRKLNFGDTIQVKQTSISAFAYQFYFQMFEQGQTGGLFSVPPANIKGNFTSGDGQKVLGLFTAHDVSPTNVIIIDQAIENQLKK